MKKVISMILALVMCLSLCACGGGVRDKKGKMTKEEMLAAAQSFDSNKFNDDCNNNIVQAKEKYIGNIYRRAALVTEIKEDGCYAGGMFIPLDKEDVVKLTVGNSIEIVFRIGDVEHKKVEVNTGGYYYDNNIIPQEVYYNGNISKFKAELIDIATNGCHVYLLNEFGGMPCGFDVELTQEQVDTYHSGQIIYVEGTLASVNHYYYNHIGKVIDVNFKINNAVIVNP